MLLEQDKVRMKVNLSIDNFVDFIEDEDYKNAICRIDFLSTRPNSHKQLYFEDVLKKYASSVIGNWITAEYSELSKDATTHTDNQKIVGNIPDQDVKYSYDEDGYLVASVDGIISKLYATDIYNLFLKENNRSVSCELLANFINDKPDENGNKIVESFDICAITILGLDYKPSVPNSKIEITRFSELDAKKDYKRYISHYSSIKAKDEILNKLNDISDKLELDLKKEEENMTNKKTASKFAVEIGDNLHRKAYDYLQATYPNEDGWGSVYSIIGIYEDNSEKYIIIQNNKDSKMYKAIMIYTEDMFLISENLTEVEQPFIEKEAIKTFTPEDIKNFEIKLKEEKMAEKEKIDDKVNKKTVDGESKKGTGKGGSKTTDTGNEVDTKETEKMKDKIKEYEGELKSLRKFKEDTLAEKVAGKVSDTLAKIKDKVDDETYSGLEEDSKSCTYETVDAWVDKAFAKYGKKAIELSKQDNVNQVSYGFGFDMFNNDGDKEVNLFKKWNKREV